MADPQLPPGWTAVPDRPPDLPPGWNAVPDASPDIPQAGVEYLAHAPYSGAVLPISVDTQGNTRFDPNAGVVGMGKRLLESAWSGATSPGDVYTGKTPILANGQPNPQLIDRAVALGALTMPISPALRAGEMVPGAMSRTLGAPTAEQLKTAGAAGYDTARAAGLDIQGDAVAGLARDLQNGLQQEHGIIEKTAPKTFAILGELTNPPTGGFITIPGLEAARRGLSGIANGGGTEGLAASRSVRGIDDFLGSLSPQNVVAGAASPEAVAATLRDARGNYAAAMRSNDLTGTLDRANTGILEQAEARSAASNSGHNIDNSIRQRIASLLQKPREVAGFSDPELAALNDVVTGSRTQNFLRSTANMLGGGGGLGRLLATGAGALLGGHLGGGEGAALGAMGAAQMGAAAKAAENMLARRALNSVDELIRQRSPLYQQMEMQGAFPAVGANGLLARILASGALATPQSGSSP